MVEIAELWYSKESNLWNQALERYWEFVRPVNMALEHEMENLVLSMLRDLDEQGWYDFLRDKYFRWKYTAPNRYATTTRSLKQYVDEGNLQELYRIKESLLTFDHRDIEQGLTIANKIRGLGTAGASGLRPRPPARPRRAAMVQIDNLPQASVLKRIKPMGLTIKDGVLLIQIMEDKAAENNQTFQSNAWTPRKVDKILWTYGRGN